MSRPRSRLRNPAIHLKGNSPSLLLSVVSCKTGEIGKAAVWQAVVEFNEATVLSQIQLFDINIFSQSLVL